MLLIAAAIYHFLGGVFHLFFSKLLNWEEELPKISFTNRQVMVILNNCLIVFFFSMSGFLFYFKDSLMQSEIGKGVLLLLAIFWVARFGMQFYHFGKRSFTSRPLLLLTIALTIGAVLHVGLLVM